MIVENMDTKSFAFGAISFGTLVGMKLIWKLFSAPSTEHVEKLATKAMNPMGDNDKITVWGFEEKGEYPTYNLGIADASVYVSRVEAYLRLIGQPYTKAASNGASENPRGKVPFANINGSMVDDSSRIIETLKNTFSVKVDASLNSEQLATGHLIQQTLQGSLYWVLLHQKFDTPEGRHCFTEEISQKLPPVVRSLVCKMVFRNMHANLYGCGVGRMTHADIVKKGQADLRSLSTTLGKQKFIFGTDKPTSYDCDLYAWLVQLFYDEDQVKQAWVPEIKKELSNLVAYVDRMRDVLYPEIKK